MLFCFVNNCNIFQLVKMKSTSIYFVRKMKEKILNWQRWAVEINMENVKNGKKLRVKEVFETINCLRTVYVKF